MRNGFDRTKRVSAKRPGPAPRGLDPATRRLFSYLDDELGPRDRAAFEALMAKNAQLAADVRTYRALLVALGRLAAFAPSADFRVRVLAALRARPSVWVRAWHWIAGTGHPAARNVFSELLDEGLAPRHARAVSVLVARDREAADAMRSWKRLHERLGRLPALAPEEGFGDRVMARVQTAPSRAATRRQAHRPLLRLWPERRQRLAAALGMAFAPTALAVSLGYAIVGIFTDPLVTPASAIGFLWRKGVAAASALADGLLGGWASGFAQGMGSGDLLAVIVPLALLGLIVLGGLSLVSGRILYKTLVKHSGMERRHVPA